MVAWLVRAGAARFSGTGRPALAARRPDQPRIGTNLPPERLRAGGPGEALDVGAAARAVAPQGRHRRAAKVLVQHAGAARRPDDVERPGLRKGGDRRAAGHRLQDHQPEGVGARREHRHVGAGVSRGERRAVPPAGEARRGEARSQRLALRAVAHHHLGAGQVEAEEGLDVLLHRQPAGVQEDRPRQSFPRVARLRPEQVEVDAAGPPADFGEAASGEFLAQARRGGEGAGAALVEAP